MVFILCGEIILLQFKIAYLDASGREPFPISYMRGFSFFFFFLVKYLTRELETHLTMENVLPRQYGKQN